MHSGDRATFPPRAHTQLLLQGEQVLVTLVAFDQTLRDVVRGNLAGIDEYGLLIDQGSNGSVFIPWSSVRTVLRPPAQQP